MEGQKCYILVLGHNSYHIRVDKKTLYLYFLVFQENKPKMAFSRDLAVMDYHGLTVMDDFHERL